MIVMIAKYTKTLLFAFLAATMILPFSATNIATWIDKEIGKDVFRMILPFSATNIATVQQTELPGSSDNDAITENESDFKMKTEFENEKEAKKYYKELELEIKRAYAVSKDTGNTKSLNELKEHGVYLIHRYDPDASPLPILEDEYFELLEKNDP